MKEKAEFWKNAYRNSLGPNTHTESHMAEMEYRLKERIKKIKKRPK